MTAREKMQDLRARMEENVKSNILPFWAGYMMDEENGGFYGYVGRDKTPDKTYPKAVVLNTRMLWTFSTAYSVFGDDIYKTCAKRAFEYLRDHFWDKKYGGVAWMVNHKGDKLELEKRTYGQAFIIYSMAQYYKVFGDAQALEMAMTTFKLVQENVKYENGGYADSVQRDWSKDFWVWRWVMNADGAPKLLNSHLHLFEATITLLEATGDEGVKAVLAEFIDFLIGPVVDENLHHLKAGMDENNNRIDNEVSYGHDSECCYLIVQAAHMVGDAQQIKRAEATALDIMDHVYAEAMDPDNGGMFYERDYVSGHVNKSKVWWAQAEGITSFFNCYQLTKDEKYLDAALNIWNYTEENVVDPVNGEWKGLGDNKVMDDAWRRDEEQMKKMVGDEIASKAKCPYHNARTCFEIMARADRLLAEG